MTSTRRTAQVEQHILQRAHRGLDALLAQLESMAALVDALPGAELEAALDPLLARIDRTLRAHVEWEEQVCFPDTERVPGAEWATRFLEIQHTQLASAIEALSADRRTLASDATRRVGIGRHLHVLHALLTSHLEQEERVILRLLLELPE